MPHATLLEGGDATGSGGPHLPPRAVSSLPRARRSAHSAARTRLPPPRGGDGLPDTLLGIRWGNVISELPRESRQVPYTVSRQRPFARRRRRTLRPPAARMRCKNPCVFLRRCALGWYVRFVTRIPFQRKDRFHYNTPHPGRWQPPSHLLTGCDGPWITWGQRVPLVPRISKSQRTSPRGRARNPTRCSQSVVRPAPVWQVINNDLHTCGQTCSCGVLCPDCRGCPDAAHFCSAGTPRTMREPPDTPPGAIHTHDHRLFTRGPR